MKKLKYILGSGAASVALALGVALPASAAQTANCDGGRNSRNDCKNVHVNRSRNRSRNVRNGSAIIRSHVEQRQNTRATNRQHNEGFAIGIGTGGDANADSRSSGRNGGDSDAHARGGDGDGFATNEQHNESHTTATGTQMGGVWFSSSN